MYPDLLENKTYLLEGPGLFEYHLIRACLDPCIQGGKSKPDRLGTLITCNPEQRSKNDSTVYDIVSCIFFTKFSGSSTI